MVVFEELTPEELDAAFVADGGEFVDVSLSEQDSEVQVQEVEDTDAEDNDDSDSGDEEKKSAPSVPNVPHFHFYTDPPVMCARQTVLFSGANRPLHT